MPLLCVAIGFVGGMLSICFNLENGAKKKNAIYKGFITMLVVIFAAFGFFSGIKGLCPYLG